MAKKDKEEKKKGKKGIMGIITIILVPILIIVLLASFFFAIINAILNLIKELLGRFIRVIIDLFKNPVQWVKSRWAELSNWFDRTIGGNDEFNAESYEEQGRVNPTMVVENDTFDTMKTELDSAINRNAAGLDDVMLKKMLLTYYRGFYLDDTTVLIEITEKDLNLTDKEWDKLFVTKHYRGDQVAATAVGAGLGYIVGGPAGAFVLGLIGGLLEGEEVRVELSESGKNTLKTYQNDFYPYSIIAGSSKEGMGEDGHLYLKTKGMVEIYVACDKCNGLENDGKSVDSVDCSRCKANKVKYFKSDILKKMYQKEYLNVLDDCNEDCKNGKKLCYAHNVLEYLKKAYCYGAEFSYSTDPDTGETQTDGQRDCITIYSERKENREGSTLEYLDESEYASEPSTLWETVSGWFGAEKENHIRRDIAPSNSSPNTLQNIFYSDKVSQYATPVELMINLLEITGSKDFVNSFIETVGNENYIKLKLYTIRNREIHYVSEQWNRETTIEAERDIEFTVKLTRRKYIGYLGDGTTGTGDWKEYSGDVEAKCSYNIENSSYDVYLENYDKDTQYKYEVEIYMNGEYYDTLEFGKQAILSSNRIFKTTFSVNPKWKNTWKGDSSIIRVREISNITDQFYPAITEIKTWYGSYKTTNTIERDHTITQTAGKDFIEKVVKGPFNFVWDLSYTDGSNGTEEQEVEVDSIGVTKVSHRENFTPTDLFRALKNDVKAKIYPTKYSSVSQYDSQWKETTNFYKGDPVTKINNYNDVINLNVSGFLGAYHDWTPDKGPFSEEQLRNIQMNFVMQVEASNKSPYLWLIGSEYVVNEMTQKDTDLYVIDFKMNYTETVSEGLTNGNVTTSNKEIYTFLGLLSNKYDSDDEGTEPDGVYKLGETFVPESSGGKLVSYPDLYNGESRVGLLLENGEDMLCTLLEESERTNGLVPIMRYAMYLYKNNNYVVTTWNFNIFAKENMKPIS